MKGLSSSERVASGQTLPRLLPMSSRRCSMGSRRSGGRVWRSRMRRVWSGVEPLKALRVKAT